MGKSRRSRGSAAHRRDPISKPVKPPSDPELAALRQDKILPIIKDLQSADPKQRSSAAAAVSSVIGDARCRKLLLREQVVHTVLSQTLTDSALESRAAGWGILQVLAQEEEPDFCVHLYRQDILTAIEHASRTVSDKLSSKEPAFHDLPKAETVPFLSIAASLLSLCTALAEAQDEILLAISANPTITSLLFTIIGHSSAADDGVTGLRADALACLMILTEDNSTLAETVISKNKPTYDTLQELRKDASGDGVLACAILHNIFLALQGRTVDHKIVDDSSVIGTLAKVIAGISPDQAITNGGGSGGWSSPIEYQQLALEILASIGTSLNSAASDAADEEKELAKAASEDEDMEEAGNEDTEGAAGPGEADDDEMDEDEMQADMDMVTGADDAEDSAEGIDDLPVLKSLLQQALPELIRVASMQAGNPEIMQLQSLALSALNNIAWSVSLIDFSDESNASILKAWTPAALTIWDKVIALILSSDTADVALATQVTSLAWALARSLRTKTPIKSDEHRKFISLYQATRGTEATQDQDDPFQGLGVKCIGALGQLALDPAPVDLNREIGTFLITVLTSLPETPPADAVEAMNQIFDIYGDENKACDKEVFWKDNFFKHLEEVVPKAKTMLKTVDKRTHAELRARADEAVMNLGRFLAYKRKTQP